jgi:hypothetical protein
MHTGGLHLGTAFRFGQAILASESLCSRCAVSFRFFFFWEVFTCSIACTHTHTRSAHTETHLQLVHKHSSLVQLSAHTLTLGLRTQRLTCSCCINTRTLTWPKAQGGRLPRRLLLLVCTHTRTHSSAYTRPKGEGCRVGFFFLSAYTCTCLHTQGPMGKVAASASSSCLHTLVCTHTHTLVCIHKAQGGRLPRRLLLLLLGLAAVVISRAK